MIDVEIISRRNIFALKLFKGMKSNVIPHEKKLTGQL